MCEKSRNWLDSMEKWLTKDKFEISIGTFQASRHEIEVQIHKIEW